MFVGEKIFELIQRGTLVYVRFGINPALYTSYSDAKKCLEYNSRTRTCMSQMSPNVACCSCLPLGRQRYIEIKFSLISSNCFCNYCILWHMMPFSRQKMAKKKSPCILYVIVKPPSPGQLKIYTVLCRQGCYIIFSLIIYKEV